MPTFSDSSPAGRTATAAVFAVIAAVPLVILPGAFLAHDVTPKIALLQAGLTILLVCRSQWLPGWYSLWRTPVGKVFLILALLQAVSLAVSSASSGNFRLALVGTIWRRYGALTQASLLLFGVVFACWLAVDHARIRKATIAVIVSGGLVSLYAIGQFLGIDPLLDPNLYTTDYTANLIRPPSTLGHGLYLGGFLLVPAVLAGAIALMAANRLLQVLGGVVLALATLSIVLSGTRSALIALLAASGWLFPEFVRGRVRAPYWKLAGMLLIPAAALVWISLHPVGHSFRLRAVQWVQDYKGGPRLMVWRDLTNLAAGHVFTGIGPENFSREFPRIQSRELSRAYPDHYHEAPHNVYLDAVVSQGIPGLLLFLLFLSLPFFSTYPPEGAALLPGAAIKGGLTAMMLWMAFSNLTVSTALMLCVIVSIAIAGNARSDPSAHFAAPRWTVYGIVILGAALSIGAAQLSIQDFRYARAAAALGGGDMAGAASDLNSAMRSWSAAAGFNLQCSYRAASLARVTEDPETARQAAQTAYNLSILAASGEEPHNAFYQAAMLAFGANDAANGERHLRAAINAAPRWYKPHLLMAQLHQALGRTELAKAEARIARDLADPNTEAARQMTAKLKPLE